MVPKTLTERIIHAELAFKRFRIPHPRVERIGQEIEVLRGVGRAVRAEWLARECRGARPEQKFLPILAPSGSGKSTAVRTYIEQVLLAEGHPDTVKPLAHVTLSEQARPARAAADILEELGDPEPEEGTGTKRIKRAGILCDELGTETLILDEMQHLINKDTKSRTATGVTEMIKRFLIRGTCPMILVGTMDAEPVLISDQQMKGRALPPLYLPPLDDRDPLERRYWQEHCAGFDVALVAHGIFERHSHLAFDEIPACAYEVGRGVIGLASKLFEVATVVAFRRGGSSIDWEDLETAVDIWGGRDGVDQVSRQEGQDRVFHRLTIRSRLLP